MLVKKLGFWRSILHGSVGAAYSNRWINILEGIFYEVNRNK